MIQGVIAQIGAEFPYQDPGGKDLAHIEEIGLLMGGPRYGMYGKPHPDDPVKTPVGEYGANGQPDRPVHQLLPVFSPRVGFFLSYLTKVTHIYRIIPVDKSYCEIRLSQSFLRVILRRRDGNYLKF